MLRSKSSWDTQNVLLEFHVVDLLTRRSSGPPGSSVAGTAIRPHTLVVSAVEASDLRNGRGGAFRVSTHSRGSMSTPGAETAADYCDVRLSPRRVDALNIRLVVRLACDLRGKRYNERRGTKPLEEV